MSVVVGLIGAGFMGKTHAAAFKKLPSATIAYITDIQIERAAALADQVGGQAVEEADMILKDARVNLVDITVSTPFHPEYVIKSLEAGKHVIVEKPLALTMEEADQIVITAQKTGRYLMVAHVLRFWPEYIAIRSILRGGRIGAPRQATAYRLSNGPQWAPWFRDPKMSGGAVLDLQIHDLDMFNWLFGRPQSVVAKGFQDDKGAWNHVMSLITYPSVQAFAEASYSFPKDFPFTAGMRVICEKGIVEYHFRAGGASFEQGQPMSYLLVHQDGKPNQELAVKPGDGYENEIAYFVECVEKSTPPVTVTAEDARWAVRLALATRASMETGAPVSLVDSEV